ncbi:MAG: transcription antitermination factor NusB [Bryobacteraceae bacterium]
MTGRHKSRHRAVQILYQCDIRPLAPEHALAAFYDSLYSEENKERPDRDEFMEELVAGALRQRSEIDALIEAQSANWRIERMPAVDRNILRLAVYELRQRDLAAPIVIDEALELTRRFSGEDSVSFVNGVLDGVWKLLADTRRRCDSGYRRQWWLQ